jgi:transglutaminase-like putative cysteine protease
MASRELQVSVALAALSATVALAFGGVFSSAAYLGPLLGAALLPHLIGWVSRRWTSSGSAAALLSAGGLLVYLGAFELGSPSRLAHQLSNGWHVVVNDVVPLPATLGTVLLLAIAVWAMASVADNLAFHLDGTVSALAPAIVVEAWVRGFSRHHSGLASAVLFCIAAVVFLMLQHSALSERRRTVVGRASSGRAWRVLAAVLAGSLVAALAGATVAAALQPLVNKPIEPVGGQGPITTHYETSIPPLVNVGDQLQRGAREQLFTVQASAPEYWRLTALDEYSSANGGQWTLDAHGSGAVGQGLSGPVPKDAVRQTFHIGPLGERWMPAAYNPVRVSRPSTLVVRDSNTLVTGRQSVSGLTYTVESNVGPAVATAAQQAATAAPVPASLRRFTELPSNIPALVRETARRVTAGRSTPYAKAAALQAFFRSGQFVYDPTVVLGDEEDAMVRFLEDRRGFCVQFASTYAVMARYLGIPARVATGFTPGSPDATGAYSVTNDDAHAWPEIWLAGLGWTDRFDPTPQTSQPGGSTEAGQPTPTPAPTHQAQPVPSTAGPSPTASGGGTSAGGTVHQPNPSVTTASPAHHGVAAWVWLLVLVGVVAAAALVALVTVPARKARRRARRRHAADPADAVAGAWAEALDGFAAAGVTWPASLTPLEVSAELPAQVGSGLEAPLGSLARRYTTVRFGGRPPDSASVDAAWRDVDAVQRALGATLGLGSRLRAQLRVRSAPRQPEPAGWSGWSRRRSPSTKD